MLNFDSQFRFRTASFCDHSGLFVGLAVGVAVAVAVLVVSAIEYVLGLFVVVVQPVALTIGEVLRAKKSFLFSSFHL